MQRNGVVLILTKKGIELDLKQSNYKIKFKNLIFCFSSKFYMNKFEENVKEFIDIENKKLYNKYKLDADFSIYLAIVYYKKIEKRGFRVLTLQHKEIDEHFLKIEI